MEAQVQAYLETYPSGAYAAQARACLEQSLGLDRAARMRVQRGLIALNYPAGAVDGLFGPVTRGAIRRWQQAKGFAATGYLTRAQADALIARGLEVEAASRELINSLGMEFVRIEAGEFVMGSTNGGSDEAPVHRVRLSQAFDLGKYEVTQAQWEAVMGTNPSDFLCLRRHLSGGVGLLGGCPDLHRQAQRAGEGGGVSAADGGGVGVCGAGGDADGVQLWGRRGRFGSLWLV